MKVSLNWVRYINDKYHCSADPAPDGADKLVERIGAQLGAVEEVINLGERYAGIIAVKVVSCEKHPNADKLKVCLVDDSKAIKNIDRNKEGLIKVVCGAPNVKAGQTVAWIPPGATVPSSFDKDQFVIEKRDIRGVTSNGMLASPKELALGDSHEGLLIIKEAVKPGTPFAEVYGLNDHIIDIENKMFTHRPDLFGQLGIARELAGIQQHSFKSPDWYKEDAKVPADGRNNGLKVEVNNEVPKLVPRFCALAVKDVAIKPSPIWLQARLTSVGVRPINNVVDLTNYYMLEAAQPLHAYDYDKLKTGILGVRLSKQDEKLKLLGGKELTLEQGEVVITNGRSPIGLGGIMGGADTEVDQNTKNIILECASFDMNQIRKTSMKYGLFTDASTRFTKNQSPRQNRAVIAKAADDILGLAGGRLSGQLIDKQLTTPQERKVTLTAEFINGRLGLNLSSAQIKKLLENVEFVVNNSGTKLSVTAPFWRTDIEIAEDIVEEVGRLFGYDKLPQQLPKRLIDPVLKNQLLEFKNNLRQKLSAFGANEVLTYSFVHGDLLANTGQDAKLAHKLSNAQSPGLQYYRFNLVPSLLDKIHANIKAGYDKFTLFEIGKGHDQQHTNDDGLPQEFELLSLIYTAGSKTNPAGAAFYEAKNYLSRLADELGVELKFSAVDKLPKAPLAQAYERQRTATVSTADGNFLGILGEFKNSVRQALKLPEYTAGFEIDIQALLESAPQIKAYSPLPKFPQVHQDFCLRTATALRYAEITEFIKQNLKGASAKRSYNYSLEPLDIYRSNKDQAHKQTTWRITLWHTDRTLTTEETNHLLDDVAANAKTKLNAERI